MAAEEGYDLRSNEKLRGRDLESYVSTCTYCITEISTFGHGICNPVSSTDCRSGHESRIDLDECNRSRLRGISGGLDLM